jgi:hypothetical protein
VLKSLGYAERQVSQYFTRLPAVAHCSTPAPGATGSILSAMGKSRTLAQRAQPRTWVVAARGKAR